MRTKADFRFKRFTIRHQVAAMKVGTDGVLLGAWADISDADRILDIGTGTGLIAIMAAQRQTEASVIGVEIDKATAEEARYNVGHSSFSEQIDILTGDVKTMSLPKVDHVLCNPPFFNSGPVAEGSRGVARHDSSLGPSEVVKSARRALTADGALSIIIPAAALPVWEGEASTVGWSIQRLCHVLPTPAAQPKRVLIQMGQSSEVYSESRLVIESGGRHQYSDDYIALCKDFYLDM